MKIISSRFWLMDLTADHCNLEPKSQIIHKDQTDHHNIFQTPLFHVKCVQEYPNGIQMTLQPPNTNTQAQNPSRDTVFGAKKGKSRF
jgi:hypothetical protein